MQLFNEFFLPSKVHFYGIRSTKIYFNAISIENCMPCI